jgi:hypothetical protein
MPLPESPPWWQVCEVAAEDIFKVCAALHQLYHMDKVEPDQVAQLLGRKLRAAPATPSTPGPVASEPSPAKPEATEGPAALQPGGPVVSEPLPAATQSRGGPAGSLPEVGGVAGCVVY